MPEPGEGQSPTFTGPQFGRSCRAHMDGVMVDTEQRIAAVFARVRSPKRLTLFERDQLSRMLAGVVGDCESLRVWLGMGAPQ